MQGERAKTDENDEYYEVQSKQLYGMAKAFLTYVKGSIDR